MVDSLIQCREGELAVMLATEQETNAEAAAQKEQILQHEMAVFVNSVRGESAQQVAVAKETMAEEISTHFRELYESEFAIEQRRREQMTQQFRGDMEHRLQAEYLTLEAGARREIESVKSRCDELVNAAKMEVVSTNAAALRHEAMCAEESRAALVSNQRLRVAESSYGDADAMLRNELDTEALAAARWSEQVQGLRDRYDWPTHSQRSSGPRRMSALRP